MMMMLPKAENSPILLLICTACSCLQYLVKWVGFNDEGNTWQLAKNMRADMTKVGYGEAELDPQVSGWL